MGTTLERLRFPNVGVRELDEAVAVFRSPLLRVPCLRLATYELLGVAKLPLDDTTASAEAFTKALEIERAKNPQSGLCGNLMKRVAAL